MGFYVRKALRVGPFRFNISQSGVGVSVGVRGLRLGISPRGNYIHVGRAGLYYRATIFRNGSRSNLNHPNEVAVPRGPAPSEENVGRHVEMQELESAETTEIFDATSADLVAELNVKRRMYRSWPWVLAGGNIAAVAIREVDGATSTWSVTIFLVTLVLTLAAMIYDRMRKTTVLMYDLDDQAKLRFESIVQAIEEVRKCGGRWSVVAKGDVDDPKYFAGAAMVIRRRSLSAETRPPVFVKANVPVPTIIADGRSLCFFPDRLLLFDSEGAGGVSYGELEIRYAPQQFIEDGVVPKDADVVDRTWRYVNRNGGPDRRFKHNRELPVCLYEGVSLSSAAGLRVLLQWSRTGIASGLEKAVRDLARLHGQRTRRTTFRPRP